MGNLDKYQDIVVAAKKAGGVDNLIKRYRMQGALVGALGTVTVMAAIAPAKRYLDDKKAREALAEDAKVQLKAAVEDSPSAEVAGPESDEDAEE